MNDPWTRKEVIGDCTLYLGDARLIAEHVGIVGTLMSDPPYGMSFQSNHRGVKHKAIANDGNVDLLKWACDYPVTHSRYVFCRWDNLLDAPKPRSCVTWVKNNWSMGDLEHEHARQTEVALFYPGPDHFFPNGRPTDVIEAPRTGNGHHPTEKPVMLMWAMIRWTDGLVFDPFMGSGTTGVACADDHSSGSRLTRAISRSPANASVMLTTSRTCLLAGRASQKQSRRHSWMVQHDPIPNHPIAAGADLPPHGC